MIASASTLGMACHCLIRLDDPFEEAHTVPRMSVRQTRRRRGLTLLLCAWLVEACGGHARSSVTHAEPTPEPESDAGPSPVASRLLPWQLTSPGMPPLVLGIYDSEQQVHCEFMADEVGDLRCLPLVPDELPDHGQFADPSCQTPLFDSAILAHAPTTKPVSIPLSSGVPCGKARHLVGHLTSLPAGSARYARDQQGNCVSSPSDLGGLAIGLTDITPPSVWQAGIETAGAFVTPRLRVTEVQTADGARFPSALADERWAEPCTLVSAPSEQVGCWPSGALRADSLFSDAQCQSQIWRSDGCLPAPFGDDGSSFFSLLPYSGPVFRSGLVCFARAAETDPGAAYFSRGSQLAGDVLGLVQWQLAGTGRFQHRVLVDDQARPVALGDGIWQALYPSLRIEDRQSAVPCQVFWTDRGVRCLPDSVYVNTLSMQVEFADAECSDPAYLCPSGDCDGGAFMPGFQVEHGHLRAEPLRRAQAIGNRYWARTDGICAPGTLAALSFFRAQGELSWDAYPELEEINGEP